MKLQRNYWLWIIPVLLLAAGLAAQRLNDHPFDVEELASMLLAGDKHYGPYTPAEVREAVATIYPDQAYGLPMSYWVWGRVFGWSEFAVRVLPLFAGVLALAWTYRTGRDLFAPLVGLVAAMLLASSAFFITYMHVARAFTMVALFAVMTIWGYWRLALRSPASGSDRGGELSLLVGSIGIFYTHYYSVLLLAALGLWHLLITPKGRRWWRPVLLWGLAGIAFLPELAGFLQGMTWTQTKPWFTEADKVLRTAEVLPLFLYVFTNGILQLPGVRLSLAPNIVVLVLLSLVVAFGWWRYRQRAWFRQLQFLLFTTLLLLLLMLIGNEILLVMRRYRLRYWMALWPMSALLIGWGIWRMRGRWRLAGRSLIGVWVIFGIWTNSSGELRYEFYGLLRQYPIHLASAELQVYASPFDLLLLDDQMWNTVLDLDSYYFRPFLKDYLVLWDSPGTRVELSRAVRERLRFWLLAGEADGETYRAMTAQLPADIEFCERFIDREDLVLELYAWSAAHCPTDEPAQLRFGEGVELVASKVEVVPAEMLRVDLLMHTESSTGMTAYSVALHVFDAASGEKVAQGDQGLWLGRYNPLRSEMDISGLLAGDYELRVAVYNWQNLERLAGEDLASGATADLLTLFRFRVE